MLGTIANFGADLAIRLQLDPSLVVQEPRNYGLSMSIKPRAGEAKQQELHYASAVEDKLVMPWGVRESWA